MKLTDGIEVRMNRARRCLYPAGSETPIAQVFSHHGQKAEVEAANLFANAPDLYAACERALTFTNNGVELGYINLPDEGDPGRDITDVLYAALQKARGKR